MAYRKKKYKKASAQNEHRYGKNRRDLLVKNKYQFKFESSTRQHKHTRNQLNQDECTIDFCRLIE